MLKKQARNRFQPVVLNPQQLAEEKRAIHPGFKKAYDALDNEFATLRELLNARQEAGLTQSEVAMRMGVSQPVLARIEGSLGNRKHTPSLNTLRKYAQACGKKLVIRIE